MNPKQNQTQDDDMNDVPTPYELQLKKFRHDVNNHLAVIESFLSVCRMTPMNEDLCELH